MHERILLPTDGSPGSRRAIDYALQMAEESGATVHALSVVDTSEYASVGGTLPEPVEEGAREALEEVEEAAGRAGVDVETSLRRGVPHSQILAVATETDADVIVMGTHGRTGLGRVLLGSVTERVVRESTVPVITLRMIAESPEVESREAAVERAEAALSEAGHDPVELLEDPYRGSNSWVVPYRGESGEFRVYVDAGTGRTRISQIHG